MKFVQPVLAFVMLLATGALADDGKLAPGDAALAERLKCLQHEAEDRLRATLKAAEVAPKAERSGLESKAFNDEVVDCRQMIDLALTKPEDPAARDALIWVIDKANRSDSGDYGDEVARAGVLLVRHHGNDSLAAAVMINLKNGVNPHRDAINYGFLASAKSREARGVARLALAIYLEQKVGLVRNARKFPDRVKRRHRIEDEDGKTVEKQVDESNENFAYRQSLQAVDPEQLRADAERLYNEVASDYGDVILVTPHRRQLAALLQEPDPKWNGETMTDQMRRQIVKRLAVTPTLGPIAEGHLDEMNNLVPGKPAPEIDGVTLDGSRLKLSDYRGKVVVLTFWGSWCGPCISEMPHERELAAKYQVRPFAMLGVDCRDKQEAASKVVAEEKLAWPHWYDGDGEEGPIVRRYHIRSYPTMLVIDAKGIIRHNKIIGSSLDEAVAKLLGEIESVDVKR